MTPCPVCQKPVDALRARHVGVRDGKIVAFCSAECAAMAAASDARAATAAVTAAEAAAAASAALKPARAQTEKPEKPAKGKARTPAAGVPVVAPAAAKDEGTGAKSAPVAAKDEPSAGAGAKGAAAAAKGAKDAKDAPAGAKGAKDAKDTKDAPAAGAKGAPAAGPAKEVADAAAAGGAADSPSASGIRRIRRRKDRLDERRAFDWLDDEPAEVGSGRGDAGADDDADERPRGRTILVAALVIAVLAGGGYLAYRFLAGPSAAPPADAPPADAAVPAEAPSPPPTPEQQRKAALDRATQALQTFMKAEAPPQQQRLAAGALSRTGDAAAVAILAAALEKEPSEAARLELAYQLARAGDKRGTDRLVAGLASQNRDRRLEAATHLVHLGDARAVPVLTAVMAYSQFRLSAAAELAHLGDAAVIAALEAVRADASAGPDDKARATIALGRARRATPEELRALLADKRNAEAAPVLAALGDAPVKPVLYEQLGYEHVRVEAARALRRFGADGDLADGLRALLPALGAEAPTGQIRAAEAILLLAGPASWSEKQ